MKIGILTHYQVNNQGAQLQLYALYNILKDMGFTVYVLTFNKSYDFAGKETEKRNAVTLSSVPYYLKEYLFKRGLQSTIFNVRKYCEHKNLRKKMYKFLHFSTDQVDKVVVGSDEVFSILDGINLMMFGYGVPTKSLLSYAPSFGQTMITDIECYHATELIQTGLKRFDALSVRDENSREIVHALTGICPQIVCDPALLFDFTKVHRKIKLPHKPYLLVYSYDRNMNEAHETDAIKEYAKGHGLITVSVGTYHKWCDKNIACNAIDWLEYFCYATAVVTDTFHGCIASAITNKPMAVIINDNNINKLSSLLNVLGLEQRRIKNMRSDLEKILSLPIDFKNVNDIILQMRIDAKSFLSSAFTE